MYQHYLKIQGVFNELIVALLILSIFLSIFREEIDNTIVSEIFIRIYISCSNL